MATADDLKFQGRGDVGGADAGPQPGEPAGAGGSGSVSGRSRSKNVPGVLFVGSGILNLLRRNCAAGEIKHVTGVDGNCGLKSLVVPK